MKLRTRARDCLYVNWALPREAAPPLPSPWRYETHDADDRDWIFVTALFFRMSGLRLRAVPGLRLGYPQINFRFYAFDGDGVASAIFVRTLAPWWAAPALRLVVRRPAVAARLRFPSPRIFVDHDRAVWRARRRGERLVLRASPGMSTVGPGPRFGSWDGTVGYFRSRPRAYAWLGSGLRPVRTAAPQTDVAPVTVETEQAGLLTALFGHDDWQPHSAWICPEVPLRFLAEDEHEPALAAPLPAAEAG